MAPVGTLEDATPQTTTSVFATLPLDLSVLRTDLDREVPEKLVHIVKWAENAACDRRSTGYDCTSARIEADVVRKGPIAITATAAGRLAITIPLGYEVQARGRAWAAAITERKAGDLSVSLELEVSLAPDYSTDVRPLADAVWSVRTLPVLKTEFDLVREIEPRLQRALLVAAAAVKRQLAQLPLRDAATLLWAQVQQPVELISNRRMWLRGEPDRIYSGGFGRDTGQPATALRDVVTFRIAIFGRFGIWVDERPAALIARPVPPPLRGQIAGAQGNMRTRLRLPFTIDLEAATAAVREQFPEKEIIETRADRLATPVKVRISRIDIFPSRQMLGFDLTLDVVSPSNWLGLEGRAHLVGRPVVKPETQQVGLENVGFPLFTQRTLKPQQKTVRIGEKPFAERIEAAFRLDAARLVEEAKRQAASAFDQALGDDIVMSGRFDAVSIGGITPVRDGLALAVDLDGRLEFRLDPDALRAAATYTTTSSSTTVEQGGRPKVTGSVTSGASRPAAPARP